MKKTIALSLIAVFCAASVLAENKPFTGKDWLGATKKTRMELVSSFIKEMKSDGVTIKKPSAYYCEKMDAFYTKNPDMLKEPAGKILKTLMVMEYDWKVRGKDSDTIAREWLGDKLYKDNKNRLKK